MNSKTDIIAVSGELSTYAQQQSRWFGKAGRNKFRLVFSFFSPDDNEISLPLASMSAYLKREFPFVEIIIKPILVLRDPEQYSPSNYAASIKSLDADLFAVSIMSPHWYPMEPYLEKLKKELPDLPILVGGYQAMLSQEETIENPNVDLICVGDGEYAIGNMVQHLQGSKQGPIDGMWEKMKDGSIFETEPHQIGELAALPFPDYEIYSVNGSFDSVSTSIFGPRDKKVLPVITGRGCPYKCTYCCNTPILEGWKTKKTFLRKYDVGKLVDDLQRLRDKYGIEYFEFWDELFLSNLKFVRAFFELYKEKIQLPFSINSRVEVMNEEFCRNAAEAGCHTIWFGIESGDEEYRSQILGRKMKNQQVIDAANNCKKADIFRLTFNIVGMPLETAANMRKTLELNQEISPEFFFFFPYIPLRGTPLYKLAKEKGLLKENKKTSHYLSAVNDRVFEMNLVEMSELLTGQEYGDICLEMVKFQEANNRLSYTEGNQGY
tara:strand:+ start:1139 stop:2614 length:1476 start_codon:yes stop_codon:yes gene_type:complete